MSYLTSENEKSRQLLDAFAEKVTKCKKNIADLKAENKALKSNTKQQSTEINIHTERLTATANSNRRSCSTK